MALLGHVSAFDLRDKATETALTGITDSVSALDMKLDTLATAVAVSALDTKVSTVASDVSTIKTNTTPTG